MTSNGVFEAIVKIKVLSTTLELRGPSEFQQPWTRLWAPFLAGDAAHGVVVHVRQIQGGYRVVAPGHDTTVVDPWRALVESRNHALLLALNDVPDLVNLHAAVLVRDGRALLLVGEPWAGKTTISLELVNRGWSYFSDDVALIERRSGKVLPLPKPPGVKAWSWDSMQHLWGSLPEGFGVPSGPFLVPPPFRSSLSERADPTWIVFLRFARSMDLRFSPISPADGAARAMTHLASVDPEALSVVSRACLGAASYTLVYADAAVAAQKLQDLTASL